MKGNIDQIIAREIIDSRGYPTIEVDVSLINGALFLTLTSKPAFFYNAKSVMPPADVFLALELGSG